MTGQIVSARGRIEQPDSSPGPQPPIRHVIVFWSQAHEFGITAQEFGSKHYLGIDSNALTENKKIDKTEENSNCSAIPSRFLDPQASQLVLCVTVLLLSSQCARY